MPRRSAATADARSSRSMFQVPCPIAGTSRRGSPKGLASTRPVYQGPRHTGQSDRHSAYGMIQRATKHRQQWSESAWSYVSYRISIMWCAIRTDYERGLTKAIGLANIVLSNEHCTGGL